MERAPTESPPFMVKTIGVCAARRGGIAAADFDRPAADHPRPRVAQGRDTMNCSEGLTQNNANASKVGNSMPTLDREILCLFMHRLWSFLSSRPFSTCCQCR